LGCPWRCARKPHAQDIIALDRSLIRENLRLSPEERLLKSMQLQRFADELRRAGRSIQDT
jgi:hypothetical protein